MRNIVHTGTKYKFKEIFTWSITKCYINYAGPYTYMEIPSIRSDSDIFLLRLRLYYDNQASRSRVSRPRRISFIRRRSFAIVLHLLLED